MSSNGISKMVSSSACPRLSSARKCLPAFIACCPSFVLRYPHRRPEDRRTPQGLVLGRTDLQAIGFQTFTILSVFPYFSVLVRGAVYVQLIEQTVQIAAADAQLFGGLEFVPTM